MSAVQYSLRISLEINDDVHSLPPSRKIRLASVLYPAFALPRRDDDDKEDEEETVAGTAAELNPITHEKPSFVRKTVSARSPPLAQALSRHMERKLSSCARNVSAREPASHCCNRHDGTLLARAPSRAIRERILSHLRPVDHTSQRYVISRELRPAARGFLRIYSRIYSRAIDRTVPVCMTADKGPQLHEEKERNEGEKGER